MAAAIDEVAGKRIIREKGERRRRGGGGGKKMRKRETPHSILSIIRCWPNFFLSLAARRTRFSPRSAKESSGGIGYLGLLLLTFLYPRASSSSDWERSEWPSSSFSSARRLLRQKRALWGLKMRLFGLNVLSGVTEILY